MSFLPARKLSCGIVILNDAAELLLCHVTGQDHWDLPKGGPAPGESPRATALRETREETGLVLDEVPLLDLGRLDYRPRKDLHLFAALQPRWDPALLVCESRFSSASGQRLPEMDGFDWFPLHQIRPRLTPKLAAVLCERLDLAGLLQQLRSPESELLALTL